MSNTNNKPTFAADQEGLHIAQTIARVMNVDFDFETTREAANNLHRSYFDALRSLLGPTVADVEFDASAMRLINAFAEHSEQDTEKIYFDEQLDFWLLTCAQLTVVAACKQLEGDEYRDLISLLLATLEVPSNPYLHEQYRPRFKRFLIAHHDCLELSHALSRAMIVFTICHELGHVLLGHTRTDESLTQEKEADELAATFFARVIEAGSSAGHIFVHSKLSGAPILMMHFFDMFERHRFKQTGREPCRSTHPQPLERGKWLRECLSAYLGADALYVLNGCVAALEDIAQLRSLDQQQSRRQQSPESRNHMTSTNSLRGQTRMEDRVKITVVADEEEVAIANSAIMEATKGLGAEIRLEPSASRGKRRGMVELSNFIIWVVAGGANLTAGVLGNLIYDKLVAVHFRPKITTRNEKREIVIVDASTGLRISIKEEFSENG